MQHFRRCLTHHDLWTFYQCCCLISSRIICFSGWYFLFAITEVIYKEGLINCSLTYELPFWINEHCWQYSMAGHQQLFQSHSYLILIMAQYWIYNNLYNICNCWRDNIYQNDKVWWNILNLNKQLIQFLVNNYFVDALFGCVSDIIRILWWS